MTNIFIYLESGVGNELDGEVQHETVRVVLGQSVDEGAPRRVLDELRQPRGRLSLLGEDRVGLLRVKRLEDHVVEVVLDLLLDHGDFSPGQDEPLGHEVGHLRHGQIVLREQLNHLLGVAAG